MKKNSGSDLFAGSAEMPPDRADLLGELSLLATMLSKATKRVGRTAAEGSRWEEASAQLSTIQETLRSIAALSSRLDSLRATWSERAQRQLLELEADFREACSKRGWRIDGQWPTLYVERGISITIDEAKGSATVAGRKVNQPGVSNIVIALEPLVRDLIPRNFSTHSFINELAAAYDGAGHSSTQKPLLEVYRTLVISMQGARFWRDARSEAFASLSLDQFRARLTRALDEGVVRSADGRELRLLPPLDSKDAVFLYQPAEMRFGYVGRIAFLPLNSSS